MKRLERLSSMMRPHLGLAALLSLAVAVPACAGEEGCTEIGCDSTATVSYNGFSLSGPYDLSVELGGERVDVRCNDPGSMEEDANPEDVSCDGFGFEIVGERANQTSTVVTIYDIADNEPVAVNQTVQLAVPPDGTLAPNGPDCPPVCYERVGSVVP
jgi:hypothetical protein